MRLVRCGQPGQERPGVIDSSGAIFARNPYNASFPGRVAFFEAGDSNRTVTGDRTEFIGRNGSPLCCSIKAG